jgi:hypothetical protein
MYIMSYSNFVLTLIRDSVIFDYFLSHLWFHLCLWLKVTFWVRLVLEKWVIPDCYTKKRHRIFVSKRHRICDSVSKRCKKLVGPKRPNRPAQTQKGIFFTQKKSFIRRNKIFICKKNLPFRKRKFSSCVDFFIFIYFLMIRCTHHHITNTYWYS